MIRRRLLVPLLIAATAAVVVSLTVVMDALQGLEHVLGCGEDPIGEEEGVEEVDAQEAEVGEALEEALLAGVTDLGQLAAVQGPAESNIDIVLVQSWIGPVFDGHANRWAVSGWE